MRKWLPLVVAGSVVLSGNSGCEPEREEYQQEEPSPQVPIINPKRVCKKEGAKARYKGEGYVCRDGKWRKRR